jgi:hypothetical protein
MSSQGFSARNLIAGLALTVLLAVLFTWGVAAQDPNNGPAGEIPEKVTVVEEVELFAGAASPNQSVFYKRYSADTFAPASSDMEYSYETGGCVSRSGGGSYDHTAHTVQLPEGAEITYLRLYFYDMDAENDAIAQLMSYDGQGHLGLIDVVHSVGTPGWSSVGSGLPISYVVHNADEALALWLVFGNSTDRTLRICGVRIQYKYTLSRTSLPLVLNESNP